MYEALAVDAVEARISSTLQAQLTIIETRVGIAAGALPMPAEDEISRAFIPTDNRTGPVLEIYDENSAPVQERPRNQRASVNVTVAIKYTGGTDLEANEIFMRRFLAAVRATIAPSTAKLATGIKAWWTDADRSYPVVDDSAMRSMRALGLEVHVSDPL